MIASVELCNGLMKTVKQLMQLIVMVKTGMSLECVAEGCISACKHVCVVCVYIISGSDHEADFLPTPRLR